MKDSPGEILCNSFSHSAFLIFMNKTFFSWRRSAGIRLCFCGVNGAPRGLFRFWSVSLVCPSGTFFVTFFVFSPALESVWSVVVLKFPWPFSASTPILSSLCAFPLFPSPLFSCMFSLPVFCISARSSSARSIAFSALSVTRNFIAIFWNSFAGPLHFSHSCSMLRK